MKIIFFDLDGTLAESKQPLTLDMAILLEKLLAHLPIAIISGGSLEQFLKQVVHQLPKSTHLENLYLLPTSGASLYEFRHNEWNKIYEERLTEKEAYIIEIALRSAAKETGVIDFSKPAWGERIEYRGGEISLSALGQRAPIALKKAWDPDRSKRRILQAYITKLLPKEFSATMGGSTTIDVTRRGVDKAYGIRKLCERLKIPQPDALYVGDELVAGGNDEAVYETDSKTKSVLNPLDTEKLIEKILLAVTSPGG